MKQKNYETKTVFLRRLRESDFTSWIQSQRNMARPRSKYDVASLPKGKQQKKFFNLSVKRHQALARKDQTYIWNLFLKSSGDHVGWIDVSTICRKPHNMANLGFYIHRKFRGQGLAYEAVRRIVRASFEDLKFHRLEAVMDLDNRKAIRFASQIGLRREGVKRHYWYQNDQWEDQMVYIGVPELFR